jgi:membrane protein
MPRNAQRRLSGWQVLALLGLAAASRAPGSAAWNAGEPAVPVSETPARTPADRSRLAIIKQTFSEFSDDRILAVSAGVTYYLLLALFPGLAALVSL